MLYLGTSVRWRKVRIGLAWIGLGQDPPAASHMRDGGAEHRTDPEAAGAPKGVRQRPLSSTLTRYVDCITVQVH